jgi:predicted transcriptional regulator
MSDHFPITIDVEQEQVGPVLRQLDEMPGVVNIHLQLAKNLPRTVPPKQIPKQTVGVLPAVIRRKLTNKHLQKIGAGSVRQTIAQSLDKGKTMHYTLIGQILARSGLSYHSIHSAITKMTGDKMIERVAPGTYRLTKAGERKYLGQRTVHQGSNRPMSAYGGEVNNRKGLRSLILESLLQHSLGQGELRDLLTDNDYSSNNMYNVVPKMREEGLIKKEGDTYTITDAGQRAVAPMELEVIPPDHNQDGESA